MSILQLSSSSLSYSSSILSISPKNVYYQTLCEKYPSFRDRSENTDIVVEISLQPWKVFKPDGVLLFSDILTPLSGMNIPFDIVKGKGPIIFSPPQSAADVDQVREFVPEESVPYVGEALKRLRNEVVIMINALKLFIIRD